MSWIERIPGVLEGIPENDKAIADPFILPEFLATLSNMPTNTKQTHRFNTFKLAKGVKDAYDAAVAFTMDTEGGKLPFLTFLGLPGLGKTHLALAIGWDYLEMGRTVFYYHVAGLLNALRDGYKHSGEADYEHIAAYARNCSLLILDDLGAEKDTEWAGEQLDMIIDTRYENSKRLVVTTNLTLDDLPARVADRLREGTLVHLKGESFRKTKGGTHV